MPSAPRQHHALPARTQRFQPPGQAARLSAHERGYTSRWRTARDAYLATHPLCVMCDQRGHAAPANVVDHIIPHRLGEALDSGDAEQIRLARQRFWDSANWQPLCKRCHDGAKQAAEHAARRQHW